MAQFSRHFQLLGKNELMKVGIALGILATILTAIFSWDHLQSFRIGWQQTAFGKTFLYTVYFFSLINIGVFVWRIVLIFMYKPVPSCSDEELPACSIIVPAYNEGRQVLDTLKSLADSDYPHHKLQIISVDDGSVDDTWQWMCEAKRELGDRVKIIQLPKNRGKRHALYTGFSESRGEVLVTVDSDSVVKPETIRNLVSPFVRNHRVGAVAGNVRVLNLKEGAIPRMLDVVFLFSFDFIRAGQSVIDTVICTPGALSAYRHSIVKTVLKEWLDQKFCGQPANIGEDRAMTNLILRNGFLVHYQQNAVVFTNVPTRFTNLCKMFLRWARSNLRESFVMGGFIFRRFRESSMLGARINMILQILTLTKSQILLLITIGCMFWHPFEFGLNVLVGSLLISTFSAGLYAYYFRSTDAIWAYAYSVFWFFALWWITPYAMLTPQRSGWLTRQIKQAPPQSAAPARPAPKDLIPRPLPSFEQPTGQIAITVRSMNPGVSGLGPQRFPRS
jgi:hyaluronan synthase